VEVICPQIELLGERIRMLVSISLWLPAERRPSMELQIALVVDY